MTKDDIIRMAREAGMSVTAPSWGYTENYHFASYEDKLERFAALVAAHTLSNIDPATFMSHQEGFEAGATAEREGREMSIEAMKQALEALENSRVFVTTRESIKHPEGTEWYDEAITALRAAIEKAELIQRAEERGAAADREDAERYRWLRDNKASFSWNPSRYNQETISGFAAFGTGYCGFEFEAAVDKAMGSNND